MLNSLKSELLVFSLLFQPEKNANGVYYGLENEFCKFMTRQGGSEEEKQDEKEQKGVK